MHLKYKNAGKWEIKRGKRCTTQTLLIENWYASINQTEDLKPDVRERHFIIIQPIHQEDIILNICASNSESNYMQQKLTKRKGEIDQSPVRVGDLDTPFSKTDRKGRQKIRKGVDDLNNTVN